jgi:hypothetical protein
MYSDVLTYLLHIVRIIPNCDSIVGLAIIER